MGSIGRTFLVDVGLSFAGSMLLAFVAIGVGMVVNPDPFIARSGVRKGGELLTAWNRLSFRIAGAIFVAAALYVLYHLLTD